MYHVQLFCRQESQFGFRGKIMYRYCRKPVFPPTNWDAALAKRSAKPPKARLWELLLQFTTFHAL